MFARLWKVTKWPLLMTLPLTSFPAFTGSFSGLMFGIWTSSQMSENTVKFLEEINDNLNDWGVGGEAPTFRQFQDTHNDFHLTRINSNDWTSKLNLVLPEEYTDVEYDAGIDKYADLETLMYDPNCRPAPPKEQWVFLVNFSPWPTLWEWDRAFDDIVQMAYVHPRLNQTKFHYAECMGTAGFLCGVWNARSPALVQFIVEDDRVTDNEDDDPGFTYPTAAKSSLQPVSVRIIDLPLKDGEIYTGSAFPSEKEQMLSIMTKYEQFEPYDPMYQAMKRFNEYMDQKFWDAPGTWWNVHNNVDNWIIDHVTKPLGIEVAMEAFYTMCYSFSALSSAGVLVIGRMVWSLGEDLLGRPKLGDRMLGDVEGRMNSPEDNFWGPIMGDFFEDLEKKIRESRSASSESGGPITQSAN